MNNGNKYRDYFDIDEEYFPQVNDSSIDAAEKNNPQFWMRTYPHSTFIEMLSKMERVLARQEKRSIWIEGAYGTGKSQCAYALKKILEEPEEDVRTYWGKYEPLNRKSDLLEKLVGHKKKGIITAYRYASGMIDSPRDLFFAIQETVKAQLEEAGLYSGEDALKDSVIAWIEKPSQKRFIDDLLKQPEWATLFSHANADEVLNSLRRGGEIKTLMANIFRLADNEGITALNIDANRLINWLKDIIDQNNIKVVFIWDEFSDYLKNNRESLSEFQKLVEFVNLNPFYFIIVTHESGQLFPNTDLTWKKVSDRFIPVSIALPDNIAFDLIGHAFNVKAAVKAEWENFTDDLNTRVQNSRAKVMSVAKIDDPRVMKNIMPLHPMAALLLKHIASAFQSNQRSMFDFIKSTYSDDVMAFQWFLENKGPIDDHPLLTVDMLWDFFYEKGKDNLTSDIRLILDTYPQQQNLRNDEKVILKAILCMQAIDQRLGGMIDLFKATDQNLSYVFEGISDLEGSKSASLAKGLKERGILVLNPISGGRYAYGAAVLAGDQVKIDKYKEQVRQNSKTSKLITVGGLSNVLSLSPALRLRFESEPGTGKITPVTTADFTRKINELREKSTSWNFQAVIAFAKDETEAASFRLSLRNAISDKQYENIVFIDALSTPLGTEAFEQYVDFEAMAMYYQGSNNTSSLENSDKAKRVLDLDWKNRIFNGPFIVYTYKNQDGEKLGNGQGVSSVLQTIVINKFHSTLFFDFAKGVNENQMKLTQGKASAKSGISKATRGVVVGLEKHVLPNVWQIERYWENTDTALLPISKIKIEVTKRIEDAFAREGEISISDIYEFLVVTYGFAPCNLSSFITGFLLKEYGGDPFRFSDSSGGHGIMTSDKLAEMIGNYISTSKSSKTTYIVKMTTEEMAFHELTEKAWGVPPNSCSSAGQAARAVSAQMRRLNLPVWCLEEVDTAGVFNVVQKYIELVQREGNDAQRKAVEIGGIAAANPSIANNLRTLLTSDNCQKGMYKYLCCYENGKVLELASEIGVEDSLFNDIRRLFDVKHACLWDKQTGEEEIQRLMIEYSVVKESRMILSADMHCWMEVKGKWKERLEFLRISCEALQAKFSALSRILDILLKICKKEDILPEKLREFLSELVSNGAEVRELLINDIRTFALIYEVYLEDIADHDIVNIRRLLPMGMFELSQTICNSKVDEAANEFRRNQLKSQLISLWKEKTGTKNPNEWSSHYRTPILSCVSEIDYEKSKRAFEIINRNVGRDSEIRSALEFLNSTTLFNTLSDQEKRDSAFKRDIVGDYFPLLSDFDTVRDALDRLCIDTYEWREHPTVKAKIKKLAEAKYNAGGSDQVLAKIDKMDDKQIKKYLKQLIKDNMAVGVEILANRSGD